jgi:hypothetical protein
MTTTIAKWLVNLVLIGALWAAIWSALDFISFLAKTVVWNWSIAKILSLFLALVLVAKARRRFPFLRF